jgi:hypothetical protein
VVALKERKVVFIVVLACTDFLPSCICSLEVVVNMLVFFLGNSMTQRKSPVYWQYCASGANTQVINI